MDQKKVIFGVGFTVCLFALGAIGGNNVQPPARAAQSAETTAETMWCDPQTWARAKAAVMTMIEAKIITDVDIGKLWQTNSMSVTVDEPTWTAAAFDKKQGIADASCVRHDPWREYPELFVDLDIIQHDA